MCFKSGTNHILNDNPSMGNVKRYLGPCKIQALGFNVDHEVMNGKCVLVTHIVHMEDTWK